MNPPRCAGRVLERSGLIALPDAEAIPVRNREGLQVCLEGEVVSPAGEERTAACDEARPEDPEGLAARAVRRWGWDVPRWLDGRYAMAVYDPAEDCLWLHHDPLGQKTLFWQIEAGSLLFSSELGDLLVGATPKLDESYLAAYLARGYIADERTPYLGIQRLLPGEVLRWQQGRCQRRIRWTLADALGPENLSLDEAMAAFREQLENAVQFTLPNSGGAWISLSGGLDSSSVLAAAARLHAAGRTQARLGAYTLVSPEHPPSDERRWAEAVAQHTQVPWHPLDLSTVLPFRDLPDGVTAEPTLSVIHASKRKTLNTWFREQGVQCVLTGDGGDTILGAASGSIPHHLADAFRRGRPLAGWCAVKDWAATATPTRSPAYWLVRAVLQPLGRHARGLQISTGGDLPLPPWLNRDYAQRMNLRSTRQRCCAPAMPTPGLQFMADQLWAGALSMASPPGGVDTVEIRTPFLHRPLVSFLVTRPWEQLKRADCDRLLQRRALKGWLPELVRRRGGKALGTWAFTEGLRRSDRWTRWITDRPRLVDLDITTAAAWREAIGQARVGQTHGDCFFLTALAIEVWLRGREGDLGE